MKTKTQSPAWVDYAKQNDQAAIWRLHLEGNTTAEIFMRMPQLKRNKEIQQERPLRWIQQAIKDKREKFPASVENQAICKIARQLYAGGKSVDYIRRRIKDVFHKTLHSKDWLTILSMSEALSGKQMKTTKKTAKATKKSTKKVTKVQKQFERAKPALGACKCAMPGKEKEFTKASKRLSKQKGKPDGEQVITTLPDFIRMALNTPYGKKTLKSLGVTVDEFIEKLLPDNEKGRQMLQEILNFGIEKGIITGMVMEFGEEPEDKSILFKYSMTCKP